MAGDALTNFRAAIDQLAWHLVKRRGRFTPPNATFRQVENHRRGIAFPLARNNKTFPGALKRGLPGITDQHIIDLVKKYQPYRSSEAGQVMRLLRNLSDRDKHRLLIPTFWQPGTAQYSLATEGVSVIDRTILVSGNRRQRLTPGLPLVRVRVASTSLVPKQVRLYGNQALFPSVGDGWNALPLFRLIRRTIKSLISEFRVLL